MNTGHAKNVTQFKEVTQILTNLNGKWNPLNPKLALANLLARHSDCNNKLNEVDTAVSVDKVKTAARAKAYEPLNDLVRRILATMKSCEMDAAMVENVKALKGLIDGSNIQAATQKRKAVAEKAKALAITEGVENVEPVRSSSVSRLGYDTRLSNFKKVISLIETAGNYASNQPDLSITALTAFAELLTEVNNATNDAYDLLTIKRQERNDALYGNTDSIMSVMGLIKNELESIETKQGVNYKKVIAIKFNKYSDA
jgi:hypothetical protein